MNMGTWNVQGISGKMEEVILEVTRLRVDIVVLTETKKKGVGVETAGNYIHVHTGVERHQRAKRGVSVLIHKRYQGNITSYEAVDENIIKVNMNLKNRPCTLLGVYGISNDELYAVKDEFFEKLNDEITKIGNNREIIIMGDLNGKTGRKRDNKVVGPYGETSRNDNGERLIELCESHGLKITNGFYKHKEIHTYTWVQTTRNLRSIIDYVIVKQSTALQINDVRVYTGVTCGSDHYLVKSRILFPFGPLKNTRGDNEEQAEKVVCVKYNLNSLTHESTITLYQNRLDEKLTDELREQGVEEVYGNIVDSIKKAAEEALGLQKPKESNKLWWTEEVENIIKEKKKAYLLWLSSKKQEDRDEYMSIKRTTRRAVTTAKREMWDRKCQEINSCIPMKEHEQISNQ
ncbi:craniofacial development protein 2-like [Coccinella septempunctata]|uniref:craniofacial development protein 2-like n=1 Tax=Coccinella septempunctata TaxID=41139 RepID=UPI001D08D674|nr:craniofacial development protein 2-like [Coccinella septempunctata]